MNMFFHRNIDFAAQKNEESKTCHWRSDDHTIYSADIGFVQPATFVVTMSQTIEEICTDKSGNA